MDLGSMNMNELLRNIWAAEESSAAATASYVDAQGSLTLSQKSVGVDEQRQPTLEEFLVREDTGMAPALFPPTLHLQMPTTPVVLSGFGKVEGGDFPVPYAFRARKVAERTQRRMIKNRESAARSRARKKAYIMELEAEVAKLKEYNGELQKKQVEMLQEQKNEVIERISQQLGPKAKRFCLRRTLTCPW